MLERLRFRSFQPTHRSPGNGSLPPLNARIIWTLGHLLMLAGLYLLLYAGGLQVQIAYHRLAARGDNNLPAPQVLASPERVAGATSDTPAAFTAPILQSGDQATRAPVADSPDLGNATGSTISRIVIPAIDVDAKVIQVGWEIQQQDGQQIAVWEVAEYAVGHHLGSANPGQDGNVVLAGHVGGYGMVFLDLFYVEPGDEVILYSEGQQYLYVVQEHLLLDEVGVPPEQRAANARYIEPADHEMVTLVTCWPPSGPDKFAQRVIIRATPYGEKSESEGDVPEDVPADAIPWTVR
jgi:sortase (surface protein transpeptidase)